MTGLQMREASGDGLMRKKEVHAAVSSSMRQMHHQKASAGETTTHRNSTPSARRHPSRRASLATGRAGATEPAALVLGLHSIWKHTWIRASSCLVLRNLTTTHRQGAY